MSQPNLTLLVAVYLPPRALDQLGAVVEERVVRTPFGEVGPLALRHAWPSSGEEDPLALWVQPYSGLPTRTDPRATVYAAYALGVRRLVSWDAGVAVNPLLQRGNLAIATDLIDWTRHQPHTFAHALGPAGAPGLELAPPTDDPAPGPFCPECVALLHETWPDAPPVTVVGADGPRRETAAEARMFRAWGGDLICNNLVPEAFLARELGLCYASLVTVGAYSLDQARRPVAGAVRQSLERTMERLPSLLHRLSSLPTCLCRP